MPKPYRSTMRPTIQKLSRIPNYQRTAHSEQEPQRTQHKGTLPLLMIVGSPRAELVQCCAWNDSSRTLWDARVMLKLLYGQAATWDIFRCLHQGRWYHSAIHRACRSIYLIYIYMRVLSLGPIFTSGAGRLNIPYAGSAQKRCASCQKRTVRASHSL